MVAGIIWKVLQAVEWISAHIKNFRLWPIIGLEIYSQYEDCGSIC